MSKLVTNQETNQHYSHIITQFEKAVCVDLAVSYVQKSGVKALSKHISNLCKNDPGVRLICSFDMGITDPEAVSELKKLGVKIRIYYSERGVFHPKLWLFKRSDGSLRSLVGSANLSANAMRSNVEVGFLSKDENDFRQAHEFFLWLWKNSHDITDEELKKRIADH